jgi:hypothetical protein
VAADTASSDPGRLLSEAVAGGLLITEGVVGCSLTEIDAGRFRFYGTALGVFRPAVVSARARLVGRAVTAVHTRSASSAQQAAPEDAAPELLAAVGARALLAQARAAIAGTGDITDTEAFTHLARRSAREQRSILAVARDVLASSDRLVGQESSS